MHNVKENCYFDYFENFNTDKIFKFIYIKMEFINFLLKCD